MLQQFPIPVKFDTSGLEAHFDEGYIADIVTVFFFPQRLLKIMGIACSASLDNTTLPSCLISSVIII